MDLFKKLFKSINFNIKIKYIKNFNISKCLKLFLFIKKK